jgi:hypothetical protein
MRIEGHHHHRAIMPVRMIAGRANDLLMTQMHAIKDPDGQCHGAAEVGELLDAVQNLHAGLYPPPTIPQMPDVIVCACHGDLNRAALTSAVPTA